MNRPTKSYTVYFMSSNNSCIFYFGIDGTNKKTVTKMAKQMALIVETYYNTEMWKIGKVSVNVEEYKSNQSSIK